MIYLKSDREIALMRQAGLVVWEAHQIAGGMVRPGVRTREIDAEVEKFYAARGASPLFKGIGAGVPFPAVTCISINDEVVHGIPGDRKICDGDIVSIDTACRFNGWCADAAYTHPVGVISPTVKKLLRVTEDTLRLAIQLLGKLGYWSEIATEMEAFVCAAGFSVVKEFVGHAIGREMWEIPQIPNFWHSGYRHRDFKIRPGLVLAIEPMVNIGQSDVEVKEDQWTVVTQDHSQCAHIEHTIAITKDGPTILTLGPQGQGWATGSG